MAVRFAPDGRVFVAEKSGRDQGLRRRQRPDAGTVYADLVHEGARLLGPRPARASRSTRSSRPGRPFVYALYTHDAAIGGTAPRWGDDCPTPPGANEDGCVVSGRLSKLSGGLGAGADRGLVPAVPEPLDRHGRVRRRRRALRGRGRRRELQLRRLRPGRDTRQPVRRPARGGTISPPTAEGGALRSQDARTSGDPQTLDGSIIRVNPDTGAAMPDNPNASSCDPNAAPDHRLRPAQPVPLHVPARARATSTSATWAGTPGRRSTGCPARRRRSRTSAGPATRAAGRQTSYDGLNVNICENLYAAGAGAVTAPLYTYNHSAKVSTESCPTGGSSLSGMEFYDGGTFPSQYNGALFFADYSRSCIWVMFPGADGVPDPATRQPFVTDAGGPVDLQVGPGGDLFYVDAEQRHDPADPRDLEQPRADRPTPARRPRAAPTPLQVSFNASTSSRPRRRHAHLRLGPGRRRRRTTTRPPRSPTFTYTQAGTYTARLRVTDPGGLSGTDSVTITAGTPPTATISTPTAGTTWRVGRRDLVLGLGHAGRRRQRPGQRAQLVDRDRTTARRSCPTSCHEHVVQTVTGPSGQFTAPNHDYPAVSRAEAHRHGRRRSQQHASPGGSTRRRST